MKKRKKRGSSCTCAICNRPLSDPKSVKQGIGPICWTKIEVEREAKAYEDGDKLLSLARYPLNEAIVLIRDEDGIKTNVPHIVMKHSPTGYEWGYGGSGPAELALNIIEYYVRMLGNEGFSVGNTHKEREGVVHDATYMIYQDFKRDYLAGMAHEGGRIPANEIVVYVKGYLEKQMAMF